MSTGAQGAITHLTAGDAVSELRTAVEWYPRFFGRPLTCTLAKRSAGDVAEHATPPSATAAAGSAP